MIRTKFLIATTVALSLIYVVGLGQRAWVLLLDPTPLAKLFGVLIAVFPILSVWAIAAELRFGVRCEKLATQLDKEMYPPLAINIRPSGRPDAESASAALQASLIEVKSNPSDWRAWFRHSEALDASGDRTAARRAARTAIRLRKVAG